MEVGAGQIDAVSQSARGPQAPRISDYLDYRKYLRDFYQFKRETESTATRAYSYAMFAAAADIKSPNYLKLIMDGERNLSLSMAEKFSRALGLSRIETDEFSLLVQYDQSKDPLERSRYLKAIEDFRLKRRITKGEINAKQLDSVPGWLCWILQQMADQKGVEFEPAQIAKLIRGNVTADAVRGALDTLVRNGAFEKDAESGTIRKTLKPTESTDEASADLIRKVQSEFILMALESLFHDSPKDREFGTLTVALTAEEFEKIKFELRHLRKRIHKDALAARAAGPGDRVYQFNIQLFPVTDLTKPSHS